MLASPMPLPPNPLGTSLHFRKFYSVETLVLDFQLLAKQHYPNGILGISDVVL
jgi:hypothetical protein